MCCGKVICCGCIYAVQSRAAKAGRSKEDDICPFCRTPLPKSDEEIIKRCEKRIEMNDAIAITNIGSSYNQGSFGLPQNRAKALKLFHRAAELGNAASNYNIGVAYRNGRGVERDEKKALHYYELAAMRGNVLARNNLGCSEAKAGYMDRALRHYMIAVKDGSLESLENTKSMYGYGHATKDDYANALRSYCSSCQ